MGSSEQPIFDDANTWEVLNNFGSVYVQFL